ncbi:MAG: hypothetical protein LBP33_13490 [Candidatus Adiutrix sp.]|jgi:hypothetical protein|nr:hypothetical protein [Candidatus Adiutrix sp.]
MSEHDISEAGAFSGPAVKPGPRSPGAFGAWLEERRRPEERRFWRLFFFGLLGLVLLLSLLAPNHHPHFVVDAYPAFWPVFGLGVGLLMVFFVKKIVQPLIKRPEDYYGDL